MDTQPSTPDASAQVPVMEKILMAHLLEQRRDRRWAMVRRVMTLAILVIIVAMITQSFSGFSSASSQTGRHTAVISLTGAIEVDGEVDAGQVNESLRAAFGEPMAAGIVLRMNTPGGSPVQSSLIYEEIRRLRGLHPDKQVIAVVEDVCASGGYYIASAADQILVNRSSLVGSIGVLMNGFGVQGLMNKLGIERRLITAGENKAMLDPFLPVNPAHQKATQALIDEVHRHFIESVKKGRGDRLKTDPQIFSGMVYSGEGSVAVGLADGLGSVESVAREVFQAEELVDYTYRSSVFEVLARRLGASMAATLAQTMGSSGSSPGGLAPMR
jgi:protease-4